MSRRARRRLSRRARKRQRHCVRWRGTRRVQDWLISTGRPTKRAPWECQGTSSTASFKVLLRTRSDFDMRISSVYYSKRTHWQSCELGFRICCRGAPAGGGPIPCGGWSRIECWNARQQHKQLVESRRHGVSVPCFHKCAPGNTTYPVHSSHCSRQPHCYVKCTPGNTTYPVHSTHCSRQPHCCFNFQPHCYDNLHPTACSRHPVPNYWNPWNRPGRDRAFALSPSYRRVPAPPGLQELPLPKNDDAMLHTTRARPRPRAGNGKGRTFLWVAH
eukprot:tig00001003_g6292.t1